MTPIPKTVPPEFSVYKAQELMRLYRIRHLPVVVGNRIVGLLSDRNAKAAALSKWGEDFIVKDVMIPDPYVAKPSSALEEILSEMIKYKYGSVVIQEKSGEVVGIFTLIDAIWLLRKILREQNR